MKRPKIPRLMGGETDNLTDNYWQVRAVTFSYTSTDEELYECRKNYVSKLNDDELRYLYWELVFSRNTNCIPQKVIMKTYLCSEYETRWKRERGRL